jgi:hypothetical protein
MAASLFLAALTGQAAEAKSISITVTNHSQADGLFLTPFLTVFHDGSYDPFNVGSKASAGVEEIAEEGNPSIEIAANPSRRTAVITAPGGFAGAPVLDPGESTTLRINLDPASERYFSFLSMLIPSNDNFIGNDDPLAYQLFDAAGAFTRLGPISVYGADVWDAGTEVNNGIGAAFSTAGGIGTDENGVITLQPSLSHLLGLGTLAGTTIGSVPGATQLLASIQIAAVPLPAALPAFAGGLAFLGFAARRRRRA